MSKERIEDVHKSISKLINVLKNLKQVYGFEWLNVKMSEEEFNEHVRTIEWFIISTNEVKLNYNSLLIDLIDIVNYYEIKEDE